MVSTGCHSVYVSGHNRSADHLDRGEPLCVRIARCAFFTIGTTLITQHWRVTIEFGGPGGKAPRELLVNAGNWMAALKSARALLGEEASVPAGAACTVEGDGSISIVVPTTRQRFRIETCPPEVLAPAQPMGNERGVKAKRQRTQTIAYAPDAPSSRRESSSSDQANKGAGTTIQDKSRESVPPDSTQTAQPPPSSHSQTPVRLELLLALDEEPTKESPLTYRERAYLMPDGCRVTTAETALREEFRNLQAAMDSVPRGKFVNMAVFDHVWTDTPQRPPVIVLEWRDWRGAATLDYPTRPRRTRTGETGQASSNDSERLTILFEELQDLESRPTALDASQLVLKCLLNVIPSAAGALYLYDINTDELRAVTKWPAGGHAPLPAPVSSSIGLLGQHLERESAISIDAPTAIPHFDLNADGLGLAHPTNLLLRPIRSSSMLIGAIQLVDRAQPEQGFTTGDCNIANYAADRLSETILQLRLKNSAI